MILEGVVTNVANFGAFVDIGVHQDGLVHISMLAEKFVKDPRDVVKAGDVVKVKVLEVDQVRKRISLSMRLRGAEKSSRSAQLHTVCAQGTPGAGAAGRSHRSPRRPASPAPPESQLTVL
jgi:protein Tex